MPSDEQSLCHCAPRLAICSQTLGGCFGYISIVILAQSISLQSAKAPRSLPCFALLCALVPRDPTTVTPRATQVAQQRVALADLCIHPPRQDGCTWFCRFVPSGAGLASAQTTSQADKATEIHRPTHHSCSVEAGMVAAAAMDATYCK